MPVGNGAKAQESGLLQNDWREAMWTPWTLLSMMQWSAGLGKDVRGTGLSGHFVCAAQTISVVARPFG
jgi:hypothetical protein